MFSYKYKIYNIIYLTRTVLNFFVFNSKILEGNRIFTALSFSALEFYKQLVIQSTKSHMIFFMRQVQVERIFKVFCWRPKTMYKITLCRLTKKKTVLKAHFLFYWWSHVLRKLISSDFEFLFLLLKNKDLLNYLFHHLKV